ncbi:MAG: polymerase, sigma 28 subunit, FliA/WhiG subfamily [Bacteroidetes bacterium]|nr:polymerase, sigma 28 subunit, FliA/WhiG subfamily [Bacteroidota bacterium]
MTGYCVRKAVLVGMEQDFSQFTNEELLIKYKHTKDIKIKHELVMRYMYMVKSISIQMRDVYLSFAQVEDIVNEGVLTIMGGIEKFDPDMNVKFETYISKRIRGMIIDMARKQDWIPRSVRKNAKELEQAAIELCNRLGRFPTPQETADHMNISLEKYLEAIGKTNVYSVLSLDMVLEPGTETKKTVQMPAVSENDQPENHYLQEEFKQLLVEAINNLKDNEQKVISLYYMDELNMKEIAHVMNVSEPRISQIHSNAIQKLKIYLTGLNA